MARQQTGQANTLFNESQGIQKNAGQNAGDLYGQLFPTYAAEAAGKPTAGTIAANTAAQQSVGGAQAGALGRGELEAARTGNSGANSVALDDSVRSGQHSLSNTAADITSNEVGQGQRGLASLYGQQLGQQDAALGLGNSAVNTGVNAGKSGWFQNFLGTLGALKPNGSFGGSGGSSFGFGG